MTEHIPIVSKNGKTYQINVNKVWTIWMMVATFIVGIFAVALWWVNDINFKQQSSEERLLLLQAMFEVNYNVRKYIEEDWTRGSDNNKKLNQNLSPFQWHTYQELAKMLQLKPLKK